LNKFTIFKKVNNSELISIPRDQTQLDQIMAILKSHSLLLNELKADVLAISEKKVQKTVVC